MKLGAVREGFRLILDGMGYVEHPDGFNSENIPSSLVDKAYHLSVGQIFANPRNHQGHTFRYPVSIKVFFKGYRDPSAAIDEALNQATDILAQFLSPANSLAADENKKDIRPLTVSVSPLALSNDNSLILEIGLEVYLIYCF